MVPMTDTAQENRTHTELIALARTSGFFVDLDTPETALMALAKGDATLYEPSNIDELRCRIHRVITGSTNVGHDCDLQCYDCPAGQVVGCWLNAATFIMSTEEKGMEEVRKYYKRSELENVKITQRYPLLADALEIPRSKVWSFQIEALMKQMEDGGLLLPEDDDDGAPPAETKGATVEPKASSEPAAIKPPKRGIRARKTKATEEEGPTADEGAGPSGPTEPALPKKVAGVSKDPLENKRGKPIDLQTFEEASVLDLLHAALMKIASNMPQTTAAPVDLGELTARLDKLEETQKKLIVEWNKQIQDFENGLVVTDRAVGRIATILAGLALEEGETLDSTDPFQMLEQLEGLYL